MRISDALRACSALALLAAVAPLVGCGGGKTSAVTGKVTYQNHPVTGGSVTLHAVSGPGTYPGFIKPDGTYVAEVPPGDYKVTVETDSARNAPAPQDPSKMKGFDPDKVKDVARIDVGNMPTASYVKIPDKYKSAQTTPLTVTVKKGKQDIPLALAD
jgi:hypothetical protein